MPPLAVFLKAPRLGTVKTRLAAEIGERHALRLYRVLAARTLTAVRTAGLEAIIWYSPPDARTEMEFWLGDAWELRPQVTGVLGARLVAAAHAVPRGHPWVAIGADCPALTAPILREACAHLERTGLVIGPAYDGGYYLIGGRTPLPESSPECRGAPIAYWRKLARDSLASAPRGTSFRPCATSIRRTTRAPKDS